MIRDQCGTKTYKLTVVKLIKTNKTIGDVLIVAGKDSVIEFEIRREYEI